MLKLASGDESACSNARDFSAREVVVGHLLIRKEGFTPEEELWLVSCHHQEQDVPKMGTCPLKQGECIFMRLTKPIVKLLAVTALAALTLFLAPSTAALANTSGDHENPTLRQLAARLGIHAGSAVNDSALSADSQYAQILGQQFAAITPENEMKWASVEAQRGVFTFGPADAEVQFAEQHHQVPGFFTGGGTADLYDENFAPKPAYGALIQALEHPVSWRFHHG